MVSSSNYQNPNISNIKSGSANNDPVAFVDSEKRRIQEGTEMLKKELMANWQKRYAGEKIFSDAVSNINPAIVDFLLSFSLVDIYNEIAQKSGLDNTQRDFLPRIIWKACIEGKISDIENILAASLKVSDSVKMIFLQLMREKVLGKLIEFNSKSFVKNDANNVIRGNADKEKIAGLEKASLSSAMATYKNLGEQIVTSSPIKLRVFPEPVRPSIKNWLADYHDHLGSGKHTTIERGNFLFHSANAKKINSAERRKLAEILKASDGEILLNIDPESQRIIFQEEPQPQIKPQTQSASSQYHSYNPAPQPMNTPRPQYQQFAPQQRDSYQNQTQAIPRINHSPSALVDQVQKVIEKKNENNLPQNKFVEQAPAMDVFEERKEVEIARAESLNRNFGGFHVGETEKPIIIDDRYEIPGGNSSSINKSLATAWNPAEAVKKRMEEESKGIFSKKEEQDKGAQNEVPEKIGTISFSTNQVLPVEKKMEVEKPQTESSKEDISFQSGKSGQAEVIESEELIERIKKMNQKSSSKNKSKAVFKITPMGFVGRNDEIEYEEYKDNPRVKGNVVDLS